MSEHIDNDVSVQMCPDDSREKLEADVYEICRGDNRDRYLALIDYCKVNALDVKFDSILANYEGHLLKAVLGHLLDRRATISWDNAWKAQKDLIAKMQAEIDELTAERDNLQFKVTSFYDMCGECKLVCDKCKLVASLTADRDEWKTKCETCEVAYKQADAERKRYSEQIDELTAERDNLRLDVAVFYDMCDECKTVASLTGERDQLKAECDKFADERDCMAKRVIELTAERDELKAKRDIREVLAENVEFWENKRNQEKVELATYWKDIDQGETINKLSAKVDELTTECNKLKGRLENQATYIDGVEDNLCRYELQVVRNEKDFEKLTAERDHLQATVDALRHDQENVEPAATDDRLTAGQAREIRTKSDGKWVQRTSERIIREFLYQVRERSEQGLSDYTLNLSTYPSDEVRKTVLKELSELGYKYVRYHFWSKKRYIVYW